MPIEHEPGRHRLIKTFDTQRQQMDSTYRVIGEFIGRSPPSRFWKSASQPCQEARSPIDSKKLGRKI